MTSKSTNTFDKKITAIGFILTIFAGNFWLIFLALSLEEPAWVASIFRVGVVITLVGSVLMLINKIKNLILAPSKHIDNENDLEAGDDD